MVHLALTRAILTCVFAASFADTETCEPSQAPWCSNEPVNEFYGTSSLVQVVSGSSSQIDVDDTSTHEYDPEATEANEMEHDPTKMTFNCKIGIVHWVKGWSELKKSYCCRTVGIGCPLETADVTEKEKRIVHRRRRSWFGDRTANATVSAMCVTGEPLINIMGYTTSLAGTKCVFGLDERDEGKHCILSDMKFGSLGWCYTSKSRESWGPCSESCPLFGQMKVLGKKLKKIRNELEKIVNPTVGSKANDAGKPSPAPKPAKKKAPATTAPKKLEPATASKKKPAPAPAPTASTNKTNTTR